MKLFLTPTDGTYARLGQLSGGVVDIGEVMQGYKA